MSTESIRKKLHEFIETIEEKRLQAIYVLFEDEMDTESARLKLIRAERQKHLVGEGKVYSWDAVKEIALDKSKRDGL